MLSNVLEYHKTYDTGLHLLLPLLDRVVKKVDLKERVVDFKFQLVNTKDNVTKKISLMVFFQVMDPKLFVYGEKNPIMKLELLSATTLRNIINEMESDKLLTSRDIINTKMRLALDTSTNPWGIKIRRVVLKNIV